MNVKSNLHSFKGYLSISNDVVETDYRLESIFSFIFWGVVFFGKRLVQKCSPVILISVSLTNYHTIKY